MVKILIADDEPIERTIIERTIMKNFPENVEIVKAANGREAVKLYEEEQCQIALLDIEMPELNGLQLIQKIKNLLPPATSSATSLMIFSDWRTSSSSILFPFTRSITSLINGKSERFLSITTLQGNSWPDTIA